MLYLLKADLLKLKYLKVFRRTLIFTVIILLSNLLNINSSILVSGDRTSLGNSVGFIFNSYIDASNPSYDEILRTSLSSTFYFWIIILILSTTFLLREYSEGTIKLAISYGYNSLKVYVSKLIIVAIYVFFLYYTCVLGSLFIQLLKHRIGINLSLFISALKLITLNYMVMISFILICFFLCILIKKSEIASLLICLYIFSGAIFYLFSWSQMEETPIILRYYINSNPIMYWMSLSSINLSNNVISNSLIYFFISMIVLLISSYLILRNQEFE